MKKIYQLLFVGTMGLSMAACSGQLQSKSGTQKGLSNVIDSTDGSLSEPTAENIEINTKAAEEAAADAEQALAEAEAALAELTDSNGELKIFSSGVGSASAEVEAQFVSGKIDEILKLALAKLQIVPQTFDTARAKLVDVMSKLDANNPAHKLALDKLTMVMGKLDQAQEKVRVMTLLLADKIDILLAKVDELSARLASNPFTSLLLFEVNKVKTVIVNFQTAVRAL